MRTGKDGPTDSKTKDMGRFSWFGDQEHRVFDYKPIYYDKEKEELKQKFGDVDGSKEKGEYVPGSYIHGAFRDGNYARRRGGSRVQAIIGLVSLVLIFGVLYFIAKFYTLL